MEGTFLSVRRKLYTPAPEIGRWQSRDRGRASHTTSAATPPAAPSRTSSSTQDRGPTTVVSAAIR
jgi:hypothetical protein